MEEMNVMILDNDRALLRSLEIVLAGQGHRVHSCETIGDACAAIDRSSGSIDAVVVDYMLTEATAIEALARIAPRVPGDCRRILISGHTDLVEQLDLSELGVTAFLPKPIDLERLFRLLQDEEDDDTKRNPNRNSESIDGLGSQRKRR